MHLRFDAASAVVAANHFRALITVQTVRESKNFYAGRGHFQEQPASI